MTVTLLFAYCQAFSCIFLKCRKTPSLKNTIFSYFLTYYFLQQSYSYLKIHHTSCNKSHISRLQREKNRIFRQNKRDFLQENLPAHRLCATKRIAKQSVLQRMRTLPCPNKRRHRKKPQAFSCATVLWGRKGTTCLLSGACCGQPRSRPCGLRGDHGGQQPDPRDFPCPLPRCRQGRRRRRRVSACFPFPWVQA